MNRFCDTVKFKKVREKKKTPSFLSHESLCEKLTREMAKDNTGKENLFNVMKARNNCKGPEMASLSVSNGELSTLPAGATMTVSSPKAKKIAPVLTWLTILTAGLRSQIW